MTLPQKTKYWLMGLVIFVLLVILQRGAPIRLPGYLDLVMVPIGICLMVLIYYRKTRDIWAPIVCVTGWVISDIPPRAWVLSERGESVGVVIALAAQLVGGGLFLLGIGLGGYRVFRMSYPKDPSR